MKMVIAVVQDKDSSRLSQALVKEGFRATKLASTGGFLRAGNTTFLIGVEEERLDQLLEIIKSNCHSREQMVAPMPPAGTGVGPLIPQPIEVQVGGATVFIVPVEQFYQF
ncbi:MAG: cyclic-di-AMP receptor [Bacillaceae bacterium]|nr:cyclic-di-AMP receptor [Bacillaceae bacterium]